MMTGHTIVAVVIAAVCAFPNSVQAQRAHGPRCDTSLGDGAAEGNFEPNPWPGGIVPYRFGANVSAENRQRALDAMAEIEAVSNVDFVQFSNESNWILIISSNINASSCIGFPAGPQCAIQIAAWPLRFLIVHELMHALGARHEQQRADRDLFIEINFDNIQPGTQGNYQINGNIDGAYDFDSVMHYSRIGFGVDFNWTIAVLHPNKRNWQRRIGQYEHLSIGDIWVLQRLYGGDVPPRAFGLIAPADGALVGDAWTPTFSWQPSGSADSYQLLVDDDGAFQTPEIDVSQAGTSYVHPAALDPNRLYYWAVLASNPQGTTGSYPAGRGTFCPAAAAPSVLLVADAAAAGGSGASWVNAMHDLQDALALAYATGGTVTEIRVAQGTYTPDHGSGDRRAAFILVDGVSILGGYAGIGEPDPDLRDPGLYTSVLSGDLAGDDGPDFTNNAENSLTVVYAVDVGATAVLDGFEITAGNGNLSYALENLGACMQIDEASPLVRECVFTGCSGQFGAAIEIEFGSGPRIQDCVFSDNRTARTDAFPGGDGFGGAIEVFFAVQTRIERSVFLNNTSAEGGAVDHWGGTAEFINCLFADNTASVFGGAVRSYVGADAAYVNCTFAGNAAGSGSAFSGDATETTDIANSILWGNTPDQIASSATVTYSDVQGGFAGMGNIDSDPLFAAGHHLGAGSPGIDAANNDAVPVGVTTDLDGNPRFVDDPDTPDSGNPPGGGPIVDMGAYEFQGGPPCPWDCDGGESTDGTVGITDFLLVLAQWGTPGSCDFDGGGVGITDFLELLANWGPCP